MSERIEVPKKKEVIYHCQSCENKIPVKEQSDTLAYYFAKEFDEYYCKKCAQERHDFLLARHVD